MVRVKWTDEAKSPAQLAWDKDMEEVQKVWDLLSQSQKERMATAEGEVTRFAECFAHLCLAVRNGTR